MKKILSLILAALAINASAKELTTQEYTQLFENYNACFILYNLNTHKIVTEYNPINRCRERIAPDSTFKVAISLMAFNQNIIAQNSKFKWDGIKRELPDWNQDQTPATWIKYSALWVSQQLTPQIGYARIKHYLAAFNYGNQDFSGDPDFNNGLTHAWLASSLKISATEQLNFLRAMLSNELPVNDSAVINTKKNMYMGKLNNGADYYGKTGAGRHGRNERLANPSLLRDGWFIGFIVNNKEDYIFVSNLTDKHIPEKNNLYGSQILKPIVLKILNEYFS